MVLVAALPATKDAAMIQSYYERLSGFRK